MNIEYETKEILRKNFTALEKVRLIREFANFKEKDILETIKKKYGFPINDIYKKLIELDNIPENKMLRTKNT